MSTSAEVLLRNCDKETEEGQPLRVVGMLPSWLEGVVVKNGPGKTGVGDTKYNHLFDSLAMLHQFSISSGGRVTYRSRFLRSDAFSKNSRANRIVVGEFGTVAFPDPCKTLFQRFMNTFISIPSLENALSDNCLVNVCQATDQMFALTETCFLHWVDSQTLQTMGEKEVVTHYVAVNLATAHPHIDADGTVYNLGTSYTTSLGPQLRIIKFLGGHLEQASIVASVPSRWKTGLPYFHSFAMTPNYWVFIEQPLVLFFKNLVLNYVTNNKLMDALKWMPEEHLYFHVIERSTGRSVPIKYTADSLIILHHINAWEEDGHLILDVTANDEGKYLTTFYFNNIEKEVTDASKVIVTSRIRRFVLPLSLPDETHKNVNLIKLENTRCSAVRTSKSSVHCTPTVLWNEGFELPRINYKKNGLPYRYVYGVSIGQDLTFEKLVKLEVNTGRAWLYSEKDCVVTEPIFVAAPDAVDEDDGVILSSLLRGNDPHYVALLVLDARDLTETARAEFRAEGQVTIPFHGQYISAHNLVHSY